MFHTVRSELRRYLAMSSILGFLLAANGALGQSGNSASIVGTVTDSGGSPLPNATVTATSPALQVPNVTTVTDVAGAYKLVNLPAPGVYRVTFEANGFKTTAQQGLNLSIGFTATINVPLQIGAVVQSVTISAASPVVDVVSTTASSTLRMEELQTIPRGATLESTLPLINGVSETRTSSPDVGDSSLDTGYTPLVYGAEFYPTGDVEGINIVSDHFFSITSVYFAAHDFAEQQVRTTDLPPEIGTAGVNMEAVIKSGGNDFHGDYQLNYEPSEFQSSNVDPALTALGLNNPNLQHYYDVAADIGGRIIRNKLWFYGGFSRESLDKEIPGFVSAPNASGNWFGAGSTPAPTSTSLNQYNLKLSYQISQSTKFIGLWEHGMKYLNGSQGTGPTVPLQASYIDRNPENLFKGEIQSTPNSKLLIDAMYGGAGYVIHELSQPGTDVPGDPSSIELSTNLNLGPYFNPYVKPNYKYQALASASFLPTSRFIGGTHQFKFGSGEYWETNNAEYLSQGHGNYQLVFLDGVPDEIIADNDPTKPSNHENMQSIFGSDLWHLKRVALNLGVRWERYHAFFPTQTKQEGQFSSAATVHGETVNIWNDVVPRLGAAWDIKGDGKTAIKGSFAIYGDTFGAGQAAIFNSNSLVTTTYKWAGPCVQTSFNNNPYNNTSCDASPATLSALTPSSPNYISASGGSGNTVLNPNLKPDKTYQYVAGFERQLVPNVALDVTYVQNRVYNLYYSLEPNVDTGISADAYLKPMSVNLLRPYSDWNLTTTKTDGLTGAPVTIYYYPASLAGSAFNQFQITNAPSSRPDMYNAIAVNVTKSFSHKFNGLVGFESTKNHQWIQQVSLSPNDDRFPIDETWSWAGRGEATYNFPLGIDLSGFFESYSGAPGQRTEVFGSIPQAGSVTLRMGPMGQFRNPEINLLNSRVAKKFGFGESRQLRVVLDVFNIMNSNAATSISYLTGSTYDHVQGFVSPRVARIGADFSF